MKIVRVVAKNIFVKTRIPGAKFVINQYVGCEHACRYCYARFMCKWKKYGKWGSWIEIKENAPELVKDKYVDGWICMSSVSDAYQPIEKKIELTRKVLENMDKRIKLSILTKSDLVTRDIDLFRSFESIEVGLTVNGFKGKVKQLFEPNSPTHEKRIDALKKLKDHGIRTYGFISPVIPYLVDVENIINETKKFVDYFWIEILNLRASGSTFRRILKEYYPDSYEVMTNREKFLQFVKKLRKSVINERIRDLVVHFN